MKTTSLHVKTMTNTLHKMLFAFLLLTLLTGFVAQAVDVTLAWDPPILSENDQPLQDICGYTLCYGNEPGVFTHSVQVSPAAIATVTGLVKGATYYFAVKACTACDNESALSVEMVWTAPVLEDADRDFLDDSWEKAVFTRLDATGGGVQDSDFDGATDYDEFIAGTLPNNPDSAPLLVTSLENGRRMVMFFAQAASGPGYENRQRYYTLESCSNLQAGQWQPVPGLTDVLAENQQLTHSVDPASTAYYKTIIRLN
ncbi:MAG: fibronectin type III domain-containing protein [Lentisphaerota bacterium]